MAGKSFESRQPTSIEALKAKVLEKYTGHLFEHPEGYGVMEVSILRRSEREAIQRATRSPAANGGFEWDIPLQNRMAAAYGLVSPRLVDESNDTIRAAKTIEELLNYPDDFIEPIANKVWELSNEYRDNRDAAGDDPLPFSKRSSLSTSSPTDSTNSPAK